MFTEETQTQQKTSDPLHHSATQRLREEIQREAVPLHLREGRVRRQPPADRHPGQDLVPEQEGQGQETGGGRGLPDQPGVDRPEHEVPHPTLSHPRLAGGQGDALQPLESRGSS